MLQIKNIAILAISLIFMVMFWCVAQFFYSFNLIAEYKTPAASSQRGYEDAIADYKNGYAIFKSIQGTYPLITEEQLNGEYAQYAPSWGLWCGTVTNSFHRVALNLKDYGYNAHYVTSYNATLISLVEKYRIN